MDESPSELGGFKEVVFGVRGADVFKYLRFESGGFSTETQSVGQLHLAGGVFGAVRLQAVGEILGAIERELRV